MDIATIVGLITAITCVIYGTGIGNLPNFLDMSSVFIVVGGSIGYILISYPLREVVNLVGVYKNALLHRTSLPNEMIARIVDFAKTARREGILALEREVVEEDDAFLCQGVRLAVDGTEPDLIVDILETELHCIEERHKLGQEIINVWGDAAPAFGMIGTLIGLVIMLKNMSDPSQIGPGMAVAILTTLYGSLMSNVLLKPVATKLKTFTSQEMLAKKLVIEGIMAIQSGDNPHLVEHKLSVFLSPRNRLKPENIQREEG